MFETMESSVNGGGVGGGFSHLQSCGDSSEEELSVLPRHTKVVVTGNNRTKSVLVGLQGVVKKAVGLGGWHWLVLTNGIEVKLQRNALSVIEAPTGNEDDDDLEFDNVQWNGLDMGELASYDTQKSHRSRNRPHKSTGSSHKTMSRSLSCDSQSKGSVSTPRGATKVDLSKLEMAALWRYWRHFNLVDAIPNPSKEQLVDVVQRHFMSQASIFDRHFAHTCDVTAGQTGDSENLCFSETPVFLGSVTRIHFPFFFELQGFAMKLIVFEFSDNHNLNMMSFAGAANGRVAGHRGIRPGRKKTEDRLQMTPRQRYPSFPVHSNRYLVLEHPPPPV
ncbi:hypothetical protein DKX38_020640 [Salix brachista]|uniref:Histone deacetylase complex subunit SAP30 Sin3 binding domain-containing protein n=1 Tax=Salix brachista TaxID=2182728 RepID=A0A5N5KBE7_9ROSI|nr:hypothetical protein DKX38_020640 [Salix brachista]